VTRLLLLRHAQAANTHKDIDRPLTRQGQLEAARIGTFLRDQGWIPERAYVSTAMRARETFSLTFAQSDVLPDLFLDERLYNASLSGLVDFVRGMPTYLTCVLIVGHNPAIGEFARMLAIQGPGPDLYNLSRGFPPASLAVFSFEQPFGSPDLLRHSQLLRFIVPDNLSSG